MIKKYSNIECNHDCANCTRIGNEIFAFDPPMFDDTVISIELDQDLMEKDSK